MWIKNSLGVIRHCGKKFSTDVSTKISRDVWKSVIGLEIHAQLSTKTKLFSSAPVIFEAPPNSAVTLFDAAIPGTLPVLNKAAVELAVHSAFALGCKINPVCYFDRKHYFYSDLPAGYQITQHRQPIAENGKVDYAVHRFGNKVYYKTSKIKQIQLEQDSGKSLHSIEEKKTYIDLNRAGTALIEIVFEPDIEDEEEACELVKEVIRILQRVGSCSCKMEEGALRVDVNFSLHKEGEGPGVRTEIKNLGSISGIHGAIKLERKRQMNIIEHGGVIKNETLAWDSDTKNLVFMRDKEMKQDYRFMPEPNLPPLRILIDEFSETLHKNVASKGSILNLTHLKSRIPRLPQEDRLLLIEKYGLSDEYTYNLVNQEKLLQYFYDIVEENPSRNSKTIYLLLMIQFLNALNVKEIELDDCTLPSRPLGEIVDLIQSRKINKATVEILLKEILDKTNTLTPKEIVETRNLGLISDPEKLRKFCLIVIEREGEQVRQYKKKTKKTAFYNSLMGKIIEESGFRADTKLLPKILTEILDDIEKEK